MAAAALLLWACGGGESKNNPDALDEIDAPPDAPPDAAIAPKCMFNSAPLTCGTSTAPTTAATGATTCNPVTQTGCLATEKCTWIVDQDNPAVGHVGCVPNGTQATECACTRGAAGATGYDDCERGDICVGGRCRDICDPAVDGSCITGFSCGRYAGLFDTGGGVFVGGACDPTCDPLTQCTPAGRSEAAATACGATNAAMPNRGCYTSNGRVFTCAPTPAAAQNLTDRMPAHGPGGGGVFVNGCAPGYVPFFRESTGSQTVVCAGLCAPAKTDVTQPQNSKGDPTKAAKLHDQADAVFGNATCEVGKKGSEAQQNCLYLWTFNVENGTLAPSPHNDTLGVCFGYTHFTYDHDTNAGTPARPIPGCETLPSKAAPPANCTCTNNACTGTGCPDGAAHEWGCWNSVDSMAAFTSVAPPKRALRDFRIGARAEGPALRHAIVQ
jgi:hypothetical protein